LLLAATVQSFAHMPLGTSHRNTDMLEWFQKWCQNRLFASFREQYSQSFHHVSNNFCLFWHLTNSAYPNSCSLLFPTHAATQQ